MRLHKLGVIFLLLGATLVVGGLRQGSNPTGVILGSAGVAFLGLALAYTMSWPGVLGKSRRGKMLLTSYLLFWPYHTFSYLSLWFYRVCVRERPFHEAAPGLYLGGRLLPWEASELCKLNVRSVLDLTAEFSETKLLQAVPVYFCIPLLDRTAPTMPELLLGVEFIEKRLRAGPVYVHCALGHGRSATVVAAWLMQSGKVGSAVEAEESLRRVRASVRLSSGQRKVLKALEQTVGVRNGLRAGD